MAYVREETVGSFSDEELLQMFKESLDELGISYEEGPGDWDNFLRLDPADLESGEECAESYTIQYRAPGRDRYQVKDPVSYAMGFTIGPVGDHEWEDGPAPAAA